MPRVRISSREAVGAAVVLSLFVLSAYLCRENMDSLRGLVAGSDAQSMVLYVALTIGAVVVAPVSTLPLIPVAATLWGAPMTALLSLLGWLVGGGIAFYLARRFGRPLVARVIDLGRLEAIERMIPERNRFLAIVLLRIAIPFDALSYALGLFSTIGFAPYLAASLLGAAPFAIIFSYASTMHLGITAAGGVLAALALVWGHRMAKAAAAEADDRRAASADERDSKHFEAVRKQLIAECNRCGRCTHECAFLKQNDTPGALADSMADLPTAADLAFQCSVCGYCGAVCPDGCHPSKMFDAARVAAAAAGLRPEARHKRLLAYERIGMSPMFSWGALPKGATKVFFPGCAMPGLRPDTTLRAFRLLREMDPNIGVVLDCCGEPSRMVGLRDQFQANMNKLVAYLSAAGVEEIVVACPACLHLFDEAEVPFKTSTIYDALAESDLKPVATSASISIHDSCLTRDATTLQDSVRKVLGKLGVSINEVPHARAKAVCCGDCGGVKFIDSSLSDSWLNLRLNEVEEELLVTYCAACQSNLSGGRGSIHLLDIVLDGGKALKKKPFMPFPPLTYINRLLLKRKLEKELGGPLTDRLGRHYNVPDEAGV